jgi:hypothetical protein
MQHGLEEIDSFYWSVTMEQPSFWIECFIHIEETLPEPAAAEAAR